MEIIAQAVSETLVSLGTIGNVFSDTWYWILPIPLYIFFKHFWMDHINGAFAGAIDYVLLEIIPPKDIEKSPKPMEALYFGMQGAEKGFNVLEEFLDGQIPAKFSLELVSDGGEIHLYIRTPRNFRNLVEAHLYAQYPDCVITEVPDYVNDVPIVTPNEKWDLWGTDFEFQRDDAYPIRTYQNFEESVTGKMIDPLSGLIETMAKLPPGQKIWLQTVISPHSPSWGSKEGKKTVDKLKGKEAKVESVLENLWGDVTDVVTSLWTALSSPVEFAKSDKKDEQPLEFRLSPGEKDVLKAVEQNLSKLQFRTKMRFVLVGRRENFDKSNVSAFIGGIKQFNDDSLNSLKPQSASKTFANFVFKKSRLRYRQRKILSRYRRRNMDGVLFTMSTEELATVFHLPDMSVVAPTLARVDSKRGGAPGNLPIE
ncbi:MAG TPA: hypothetical protein DD454_03770 [Candidatus Moranbacteria bacterium]|nr:hypothetical protein [Candidatus Moranbacteria bacterium]